MKTLIPMLLLGFSSFSIFGQGKSYFRQDSENNIISKYSKLSDESAEILALPVFKNNTIKDLKTIRFHSALTAYASKGTHQFVIYSFDPKFRGILNDLYPH